MCKNPKYSRRKSHRQADRPSVRNRRLTGSAVTKIWATARSPSEDSQELKPLKCRTTYATVRSPRAAGRYPKPGPPRIPSGGGSYRGPGRATPPLMTVLRPGVGCARAEPDSSCWKLFSCCWELEPWPFCLSRFGDCIGTCEWPHSHDFAARQPEPARPSKLRQARFDSPAC
jgi:hypothetical protein